VTKNLRIRNKEEHFQHWEKRKAHQCKGKMVGGKKEQYKGVDKRGQKKKVRPPKEMWGGH